MIIRKEQQLLSILLKNQGLVLPQFDRADQVVRWFCAMQAQITMAQCGPLVNR